MIHRLSEGLFPLVAGTLLLALTACSNLPPHPEIDESADRFSAARVRAHYTALAAVGPRTPGSPAPGRARAYLERELRWAGAEVEEGVAGEASVVARLAGTSPDRVLVVAPWVPTGPALDVDDAGAALLLELARALSRNPPRYTVVLAAAAVAPLDSATESARAREAVRAAGAGLLRRIEAEDGMGGLRAVLVLEPRAGGGARIARDLRSHPVFRDLFWRTAARLGHEAAFPPDARWTSPEGIQGAFLSAGYGQVLSLVDVGLERPPAVSAPLPPGIEAFEPLGAVAYEGLVQLMQRFERVDAFSK